MAAQDTESEYEILYDGEGLTITGTRTEKRLVDSPVVTEIISAEEIAHSSADILTDLLGDYGLVYTGNGMGDYIQMQGMDKARVLLLVNGRRVVGRNSQRFKGETLPLGNIQQIEIVRGPQSALYGSDSIGGVINIITKKPEVAPFFTAGLTNRFLLAYDDPDTPEKPNPFDNFNPLREQLFTAAGGFSWGKVRNALDVETGWGTFYYDETGENSLLPRYYRGRAGLDTVIPLGDTSEVRTGGSFILMRRDDQTDREGSLNRFDYIRADAYVEMEFSPFEGSGLTVRFYDNFYQRNKDTYVSAADVWTKGENEENENLAALELVGTYEGLSHFIFTLGLEGAYNSMQKYDLDKSFIGIDKEALFFQTEYYREKFSILGGVRVERDSPFGFAGAPKLSLMYHLPRGFRVLAGAGLGYRAPSFNDLYLDYATNTQHVRGNPDLQPEYSLAFNAGLEYARPGRFAQINAYYHELFNEIDNALTDTIGSQRIYDAKNIARSMRAGIDAEGKVSFLRYGFVSLGYSWLYAYDRNEGTELFPQPAHTVKMKLGFDHQERKINTYLQGRFFSPLHALNKPDTDPRFILDLYFSIALNQNFRFKAGVDNITGLIDSLGPSTPQTFFFGLTYTL
ncbi:MAG: TonB-dependent receptor [Spirochaetaceae bacterium]|jgi:outer membrane receptor for ferrienterochelin and colicins|nr:TonB-dependent receptor [Spirochaetaceae bacterium]